MLALGVLMSQMMFSYLESSAWDLKQVEKLLSWWWLRGSTPTALHHPLYRWLWHFISIYTNGSDMSLTYVSACISLLVYTFICHSACWLSFFKIVYSYNFVPSHNPCNRAIFTLLIQIIWHLEKKKEKKKQERKKKIQTHKKPNFFIWLKTNYIVCYSF